MALLELLLVTMDFRQRGLRVLAGEDAQVGKALAMFRETHRHDGDGGDPRMPRAQLHDGLGENGSVVPARADDQLRVDLDTRFAEPVDLLHDAARFRILHHADPDLRVGGVHGDVER